VRLAETGDPLRDDIRLLGGLLGETVREQAGEGIDAEFRRTRQALLAITDQRELLAANPVLARALRDRLPYLDPLNHLQLELLRRHRGGSSDPRIRRALHLTINGIASGLRNSG
jgi:phosphoenolpyruvate carboxylase